MNIENWRRVNEEGVMVDVNASGPFIIQGRVYGHDRFPDGDMLTISMEGFSFREDAFIGIDGGDYRLKNPDMWYESENRNAVKRLQADIYRCKYLLPTFRMVAA